MGRLGGVRLFLNTSIPSGFQYLKISCRTSLLWNRLTFTISTGSTLIDGILYMFAYAPYKVFLASFHYLKNSKNYYIIISVVERKPQSKNRQKKGN